MRPQRIEPIGSDVKKNQYYFFDDSRLWIHRAAPPPSRSHKAPTSASTSKPKASKSKSKSINSTAAAPSNNKKRPVSPSPELDAPEKEQHPAPAPESPNKRARVSRIRNEEWEEIPPELQAEWAKESEVKKEDEEPQAEDGSARREREESSSSALTSLMDEDEEEENPQEEEKPKPISRTTNTKGADDYQSDYDPEEEGEEDDDDSDSLEERSEWGVDEDGLMKWERDFWAERDRIEALEGFVEWEAVSRMLMLFFVYSLTHNLSPHRFASLARSGRSLPSSSTRARIATNEPFAT